MSVGCLQPTRKETGALCTIVPTLSSDTRKQGYDILHKQKAGILSRTYPRAPSLGRSPAELLTHFVGEEEDHHVFQSTTLTFLTVLSCSPQDKGIHRLTLCQFTPFPSHFPLKFEVPSLAGRHSMRTEHGQPLAISKKHTYVATDSVPVRVHTRKEERLDSCLGGGAPPVPLILFFLSESKDPRLEGRPINPPVDG